MQRKTRLLSMKRVSYYLSNMHCNLSIDFMSGRSAIDQIFLVINQQSQASFDENYNYISYYRYTGSGDSGVPFVNNNGTGEPKAYTGMVGTHHRPSDDLSVFGKFKQGFNPVAILIKLFISVSYPCQWHAERRINLSGPNAGRSRHIEQRQPASQGMEYKDRECHLGNHSQRSVLV